MSFEIEDKPDMTYPAQLYYGLCEQLSSIPINQTPSLLNDGISKLTKKREIS